MKELGDKVTTTPSQTLLTKAIADRYTAAVKGREATVLAEGAKPRQHSTPQLCRPLFSSRTTKT